MRKVTILLLSICLAVISQAQNLDEILENHFNAIGQDKLLDVQTMIVTGKVMPQGMEIPIKFIQKRPDKIRSEGTFQGQTIITVYDSGKGWMINPMTGTTDPVDLGEMQIKQMREQADMDGVLYNWKEKGYQVEFLGTDEMEGTEVYKIKLVKEDGDENIFYIDTENYLILKTNLKTNYQGSEVVIDNYFSNYKPVDGILIPYNMETRMEEQTVNQVVIDTVKLNVEIDDSLFIRPEKSEKDNEDEQKNE
ncbi:MAG: outer membrane lipoprotein-sorting protein [Bacteroidetes bacterium]|nr:outer membrane lipoprotein-sorting protein [Bacteroidota bacterium]